MEMSGPMQTESESPSIVAVIVLYKSTPEGSASFRTLRKARERVPQEKLPVRILLYDNTPGCSNPGPLPPDVDYEPSSGNTGLSTAYNRALEIAEAGGFSWILTLDQDTYLPEDFLVNLSGILAGVHPKPEIAAVLPQIAEKGRMLSPNYFHFDVLPRFYPAGYTGIAPRRTYAFNSAATLRVSALREVDGYHPLFWLDNSDASIFHRLNRSGKKVFVAGNIQVDHEFSMFDIRNRVSIERYRNILDAGCAFWDLELGTMAGLYHTASLVYRMYKHWKRGDDPAIRKETLACLKRRLFHSRTWRLRRWENTTKMRMAAMQGGTRRQVEPAERPKISVCMAAWNGERYIRQQLRSILDQLQADDEVILVDDASIDNTRECVRALNDPRVRLIVNDRNCGVTQTFERALHHASGELIFLSDQDDLWEPNKVAVTLSAFRQYPEFRMVVSDASIIDEEGELIAPSYFAARGAFSDGVITNLLRGKYLGCVMAFRSSLIAEIFPFPHTARVFHDIWIGLRNRLSGGKAIFIEAPLVRYRRHNANLTPATGLSRMQQFQYRVKLFWALAAFDYREHLRSPRSMGQRSQSENEREAILR